VILLTPNKGHGHLRRYISFGISCLTFSSKGFGQNLQLLPMHSLTPITTDFRALFPVTPLAVT
jgi:hypothetical protein